MGLAALQLPHGYWIGAVTKMHNLHFSEIKSQTGISFVNLARASILYEMQHQSVAELFAVTIFCQRADLFKPRQGPKFARM